MSRSPSDVTVGVVMPTYNESESMLRQAIESVLNQTHANLEFAIILEYPKNDEIARIVYEYAARDARIRVVENEENLGQGESRNRGIAAMTAAYIALLDADDVAFPHRVETQLAYMLAHDTDIVAANAALLNETETPPAVSPPAALRGSVARDVRDSLKYTCCLVNSTVIMTRRAFERAGGYRKMRGEDYDLWLRLVSLRYPVYVLPEPLIFYRIRDNGSMRCCFMRGYLCGCYGKKLYRERVRTGTDSFSESDMRDFYARRGYFDEAGRKRFNAAYPILDDAMLLFKAARPVAGLAALIRSIRADGRMAYIFVERLYLAVMKRVSMK